MPMLLKAQKRSGSNKLTLLIINIFPKKQLLTIHYKNINLWKILMF